MNSRAPSAAGFTMLELLLAIGLTLAVVAAAYAISHASPDLFAVQNEAVDMQQRVRVAADGLFHDLLGASAVRPYRSDGSSPDAPGSFKTGTITAIGAGVKTYWLKTDDSNAVYQLMSYAGGTSLDVPVADNVVALSFAYEGDPRPPTIVRPLSDATGPWTTYGPAPQVGAVPPYAARENCVFVDNGTDTPDARLPALAAGPGLVPLPAAALTDGPWCPDAGSAARFDADLLRVRCIIVVLRVQAALASLRGPAGALFLHSGSAQSGRRWAPDIEITFRVSPRNMNPDL
jgi:hypothetical protein